MGSAEIVSCVFLVLFKDWQRKASPKCHLYVFDVRGRGRLSPRFSCVVPRMEKYFLDLLRAIKNREHAMGMGCGDVLGL